MFRFTEPEMLERGYVGIKDLQLFLDMTRGHVYEFLKRAGDVPKVRRGRRVYYSIEAINKALAGMGYQPRQRRPKRNRRSMPA